VDIDPGLAPGVFGQLAGVLARPVFVEGVGDAVDRECQHAGVRADDLEVGFRRRVALVRGRHVGFEDAADLGEGVDDRGDDLGRRLRTVGPDPGRENCPQFLEVVGDFPGIGQERLGVEVSREEEFLEQFVFDAPVVAGGKHHRPVGRKGCPVAPVRVEQSAVGIPSVRVLHVLNLPAGPP